MIKAIETKYKGYRFRSRLEARWAVVFDHLGIDWTYEPQGFELPSGDWYLPDFRISVGGKKAWVEIKGGIRSNIIKGEIMPPLLSQDGIEKTKEFAREVSKRGGVVFLFGDIPDPHACKEEILLAGWNMFVTSRIDGSFIDGAIILKEFYHECVPDFWEADPICGLSCGIIWGQKLEDHNDRKYRVHWPEAAYMAARSARFEHGETGA